ncbi:MAG: ABC transporter substrate-binding protein [Caldisericia bacterium]|nr:ABC transporter substrate-binding protein [Caldisericia bacterium]
MKKWFIGLLLVGCVFAQAGCSIAKKDIRKVTVLLDWTPNTNHTGVYVAKKLGLDKQRGLEFDIISGSEGGVAQLVASNKAEVGFSYQEEVTYAMTKELPIKAVATIFQHNTSGFASLASSSITTPKEFEGKRYGGFGTVIEEGILRALMEKYQVDFSSLEIINIGAADFLTSLERDIDFSWIFYGWDGIRAKRENKQLNFMLLQDFDERIDFYTPVLIMNTTFLDDQKELAKKILEAIAEGYKYAIQHPKEAAEMLHEYAPETDLEFLIESQEYVSSRYSENQERWGMMQPEIWHSFTAFLQESEIVPLGLDIDKAYTNDYLP